jgi:DNA-binding PadR family transcriptional regulator
MRKDIEGRKARKYYSLTPDGKVRLKELKEAWLPLVEGMNILFMGDENE